MQNDFFTNIDNDLRKKGYKLVIGKHGYFKTLFTNFVKRIKILFDFL